MTKYVKPKVLLKVLFFILFVSLIALQHFYNHQSEFNSDFEMFIQRNQLSYLLLILAFLVLGSLIKYFTSSKRFLHSLILATLGALILSPIIPIIINSTLKKVAPLNNQRSAARYCFIELDGSIRPREFPSNLHPSLRPINIEQRVKSRKPMKSTILPLLNTRASCSIFDNISKQPKTNILAIFLYALLFCSCMRLVSRLLTSKT